ncbi:hypothetical protein FACS189425_09450 [Clostridia bacterium]|nr:hypothetical protein FACS189425_09450 [Clostridia bacterium]
MNENILKGIACEAKECKYNQNGCECCAPAITVTGNNAQSTPDTACETFKIN